METQKILNEFVIPKCTGKGFMVRQGEVLRIIDHVGPQVADVIFLNARNYKEQFSAGWSVFLNSIEGIGGFKKIKKLYSKRPWENVMLTVIDDKVGVHVFGGHCTKTYYELLNHSGHRSCSDNFQDAVRSFGLTLEDLDSSGVFNVFMNENHRRKWNITYRASCSKKGRLHRPLSRNGYFCWLLKLSR